MSRSKVLFMLTGSIACFKSASLISKMVQNHFDVQPVCSSSALEFIGEATLEGLTGRKVFKNVYQEGQMMSHIDFCKWADLALVCPATARTINALAAGTAEDPIGSLFLAWNFEKPWVVVPAMNQQMFSHPATQKSLGILDQWKVKVLPTDEGYQACGDIGAGRLLDPEKIYEVITNL